MAKRGRKTLYREQIIGESERLAGYGFTEAQIANVFAISPFTLSRWKKRHPEFEQALKRGSDIANDKVITSLFKLAMGGNFIGSKTVKYYKEGNVKEENTTYIPPNSTAQIFWLKNKAGWKDKVEHEGGGQDVKISVTPEKVLIFTSNRKEVDADNGVGKEKDIHAGQGADGNRIGQSV